MRQLAIAALADRTIGYARTAAKLNSLVFQQSVTSTERSVLELWLDMRLLHQDVFSDGPERLFAFADYQQLSGARRVDRFFAANPHLDGTPSEASPHRPFISDHGHRIDAQSKRLWGKTDGRPPAVEHWSNLKLNERARRVGSVAQLRIVRGYDVRNFAVHTGVAAIMNVPPPALELVHGQSVANIADCTMDTLRVLGDELKVHATVEAYDQIVEFFDDLVVYAAADAILRLQGEPQRLFFRSGPWSLVRGEEGAQEG